MKLNMAWWKASDIIVKDAGHMLHMLVSREITVLTRYSTLSWLLQFSGLNGNLGSLTALLSNWTLKIRRCEKGGDEILDTLAASITPRQVVDEMLIAIAPKNKYDKRSVGIHLRSRRKKISGWLVLRGLRE